MDRRRASLLSLPDDERVFRPEVCGREPERHGRSIGQRSSLRPPSRPRAPAVVPRRRELVGAGWYFHGPSERNDWIGLIWQAHRAWREQVLRLAVAPVPRTFAGDRERSARLWKARGAGEDDCPPPAP